MGTASVLHGPTNLKHDRLCDRYLCMKLISAISEQNSSTHPQARPRVQARQGFLAQPETSNSAAETVAVALAPVGNFFTLRALSHQSNRDVLDSFMPKIPWLKRTLMIFSDLRAA